MEENGAESPAGADAMALRVQCVAEHALLFAAEDLRQAVGCTRKMLPCVEMGMVCVSADKEQQRGPCVFQFIAVPFFWRAMCGLVDWGRAGWNYYSREFWTALRRPDLTPAE